MKKDEHVAAVQEALTICGAYPGKCDGIMGPKTKSAIKAFQEKCGVEKCDGICGPITSKAISEKLGTMIVRASQLKGYFEGGSTSAADDL